MTHEQAIRSMATERYVLDEMPELERYAFEEHYFACAECADDVREAGMMREGVRQGLAGRAGGTMSASPSADIASPARVAAPAGWRVVLPWAAAASLAMIVGYQSLVTVPGLRRFGEPQAVTPVTLRPASRGAEPIVSIAEGDTAVALAVDLGAAAGTTVAYELRSDERGSLASGTASVQSAGAPLLLWVPAAALTPPGRYEVLVRDREGDAEPSSYRFSTAAR
jgi:anti-sigma factor RsiW